MDYIGEHLLPGQLGHFCAVLSFAASLVATIAYFKSTNAALPEQQESWKRMARFAFFAEVSAVFLLFISLFYIISSHQFEYKYAWQHSSKALPTEYLLSCFWEGQEGSFLLWSVWHCVLGSILIFTAKRWEAPVMTVVSFAQMCLATMLIGIYFFNAKVGSNPFILMRQEFAGGPLFSDAHYLSNPRMQDGNGLNPLLQNYWMVIHPPVLFMGFASTIVPFAYVIAGLWKKDYTGWTKPVMPWVLFSGGILGLGIMMGAAWAYESLTFGGYWAWDPVENASLVPWIVMICGLHTLLAFRSSGHSLRITVAFFILSFLLILYSTFLTRSGVLGDTSVHSFTDLGMNTQLLTFLLVFVLPSLVMFIVHYNKIPTIRTEEEVSGREFWLFVGALLLFLAAVYIIGFTSIPVYNKLFHQKVADPEDREYAYNKVLVLVAIVIGLLTAVGQYLKYKHTGRDYLVKKIAVPTLVAVVFSVLLSIFGEIHYDKYGVGFLIAIHLGVFGAVFSIVANASYIWIGMKGKLKAAGASVAHVGFGMILLGILISSSRKTVVSVNTSGIAIPGLTDAHGKPENPNENLTLVKGVSFRMSDYKVMYEGDSTDGIDPKRYFKLRFSKTDPATGAMLEAFSLYPDAFINPKGQEGILANPASKHYWNRDIFTYITSLPNRESIQDTASFQEHDLKPGDTLFYSTGLMILNSIQHSSTRAGVPVQAGDSVFVADITVHAKDSSLYKAQPVLIVRGQQVIPYADSVMSQSLVLQFNGATVKGIKLGVKESSALLDYLTIKAYQFPYINVLWLGVLVMVVGFVMSLVWRVRKG